MRRATSNDDKRVAVQGTSATTVANRTLATGFAKPESLAGRRKVPTIAVSMRQTLSETNNVVITPPLGQFVQNSFTFNSPRARTSTMKRDSLSPNTANPPELSPIRGPSTEVETVNGNATVSGGVRSRTEQVKVKDKSSKRKSNLNIAFNEESTG